MNDNDNKTIILDHEKQFAAALAGSVLDKPKLSVWMILIPVIFIFYFQDLAKYKKQRKEFIDNYLLSRKKALNEAEEALDENRPPDTMALARQAGLKENATQKYGQLLKSLADHYTRLLEGNGDSYRKLVISAYGNKGNYLFLNHLNNIEKELNHALKSQLRKMQDGVGETIKKIETASDKLRRRQLKDMYA